jgi:nitroreductase
MAEPSDIFDVMHTTRAMRRLKPDPVPDELIIKILEAGVCAANGANRQSWRFLVVKDRTIKEKVQRLYKRAFDEVVSPLYQKSGPPPGVTPEKYAAQHAAVEYLTEHYHEAPVWIVACVEESSSGEHQVQSTTGTTLAGRLAGASIYPAVQNMLLAARALGLGATLTTRHLIFEAESNAALGLPPGVTSHAILPIGYPMGRFGPVGRGPLSDFVYEDRFGQKWSALEGRGH